MSQITWIKAFDSSGYYFLFYVLQKLGYGDKFTHMIKLAFTKIESKLEINGILFEPFSLMRRNHQECPFPIVLFIIAAEISTNFFDKDKRNTKGHYEIKIVNFADDITIFLKYVLYLNRIQVTLKLYENASCIKSYRLEHIKKW